MRYTADDRMVEIMFFKQSGKYVCSEAVRWTGLTKCSTVLWEYVKTLHDHLVKKDGNYQHDDLIAVCQQPYYDLACPVMVCVSRLKGLMEERTKAIHGIRSKVGSGTVHGRDLPKQPARPATVSGKR